MSQPHNKRVTGSAFILKIKGLFFRSEEPIRHSLCLIIAVLMVGCSNSQIYNAIQENRRFDCSKLPQNQYEVCLRKYDTPYAEYERERQAIRKGEASQ